MKKILFTVLITTSLFTTQAQTLEQLIQKANKTLNNNKGGNGKTTGGGLLGANLSNTDIVSGLKEALSIGTKNASGN